jgi:Leucine-rich repeat (LRR) protein
LKKLKSLDLSNNFIDDLSPLFKLPNLEYINIKGNKVKKGQIDELINLGIDVDY